MDLVLILLTNYDETYCVEKLTRFEVEAASEVVPSAVVPYREGEDPSK